MGAAGRDAGDGASQSTAWLHQSKAWLASKINCEFSIASRVSVSFRGPAGQDGAGQSPSDRQSSESTSRQGATTDGLQRPTRESHGRIR